MDSTTPDLQTQQPPPPQQQSQQPPQQLPAPPPPQQLQQPQQPQQQQPPQLPPQQLQQPQQQLQPPPQPPPQQLQPPPPQQQHPHQPAPPAPYQHGPYYRHGYPPQQYPYHPYSFPYPQQMHPSHYQSAHQHQQQHAYHPAYGHQPPQPHPMQYHQVHNQQHAPHPMPPDPYMHYPQATTHYYTHHQQMQPPPPHQSPYAVSQPHAAGPPPMGPHPQAHPQQHPQQAGPIYSPHPPPHPHPQQHPQPHPQSHGPPPHPQSHPQPHPQSHPQQHPQQIPPQHPQQHPPQHPPQHPQAHPQPHPQQAGPIYTPHQPPPPHPGPPHGPHPQSHPQAMHWAPHGPHPQQPQPPPHPQQPPPHPQQHMMPHPPQQIPHAQPTYYQPVQPPHAGPPPPPQQQTQLPPPASPHHTPSRTHTPQHPPTSQTPTRVPPPSSTPASPSNVPKVEKKDITFPKNSVEATKPVATKKRKFTSKDVADIEVWRLLMCLKSGLLAESSWAIDVLSILLNDDSTLMYFGLQHMPGLLEAVLEHFKCCLNELFNGIVDYTTLKLILNEIKPTDKVPLKVENGISNNNNTITAANNNTNGLINDSKVSKNVINKKKMNGIADNLSTSISIPSLTDQVIMFSSAKNYTFRTRDGKIVKLKNGVTPVQVEPTYELTFKPVGYSHWQEGNGEDTSHIQVYFEPDNFIELSRRCTCISTIVRNLSFIPGNDVEMSKHAGLLLVLGRLLLLKHNDVVQNEADSAPNEWHLLSSLREDTLVIISNISSSLDLSPYNDKINLSLLDGLLHWACCSSSYALDPFPAPSMTVSPQRLALESLAKLSIIEGNVDLILATPPWPRIEKLFEVLARLLNINEDQTIREFSLVLLSNLTSADSGIARKVALTGAAIPRLITFLETSLTDSETFSTTQDMLRRAAITLKCLSQLVDNHPLFAQHQQRLLNLVMSQKLDQEVVSIIADVLFEISLSD